LLKGAQRKRIVDIFGKAFNDKLVPINETTDIVRIEGFVGKPEAAKKSRGEQFFFVNNRFFKDTYFNHAVTAAFEQLLPAKMFPSYFIFLEINPKNIDVNVHPTKTEIKFEDDKAIYSILRSTIRLGLGKFNISPTLDFDRENEFDIPLSMKHQPAFEPIIQVDKNYNPFEFSNTREGQQRSNNNSNKAFSQGIKNAGFQTDNTPANWDDFWNPENELEAFN
jgi:DNA mismatch repair protein MutL